MANMTATEQALVEALNQWTEKQGVVLVQVNPFFFMQVLRDQGLEIVSATELTKIRYQHKALKDQVNTIFKTVNAAKMLIAQLDAKDLVKEKPETKQNTKPEPKSAPRKV